MESIWCVYVCDVVIHVPPRTVRRRRANAKNRQFAHTEPAYKWHTAKLTFYLCVCGIVWLARTDKKSVGNAFWIRQNGICTAAVDKKYWTRIGNIHENRLRVFCMRFGYLNSHFLRSAFYSRCCCRIVRLPIPPGAMAQLNTYVVRKRIVDASELI